jgi:hypothetical protein
MYFIRIIPSPYSATARAFARTSPADKHVISHGARQYIIIVQKRRHIESLLKIKHFLGNFRAPRAGCLLVAFVLSLSGESRSDGTAGAGEIGFDWLCFPGRRGGVYSYKPLWKKYLR